MCKRLAVGKHATSIVSSPPVLMPTVRHPIHPAVLVIGSVIIIKAWIWTAGYGPRITNVDNNFGVRQGRYCVIVIDDIPIHR